MSKNLLVVVLVIKADFRKFYEAYKKDMDI